MSLPFFSFAEAQESNWGKEEEGDKQREEINNKVPNDHSKLNHVMILSLVPSGEETRSVGSFLA